MDLNEIKAICKRQDTVLIAVRQRRAPKGKTMKLFGNRGPTGEWLVYLGDDGNGDRFLCRFDAKKVLAWINEHQATERAIKEQD